MRKNLPSKDSYLGVKFDRFPDYEIEEHVASGSNGRLFRAFSPATRNNLAFKIVPATNLPEQEGDRDVYLLEAKNANQLEHPSVIQCLDVFPYVDPGGTGPNVVFVFDYVNGVDLNKYMKQKSSEVDVSFVENFLRTMLGLLFELQQRKSRHGDLHAGNVLVAKSEFDVYERTTFRVTDFGVRRISERTAGTSDYFGVGHMLTELLNCIECRDCGGRDRFAFDILRNDFVKRHLFETDTSLDPLACNPRLMLERLDSIDDEYQRLSKIGSTDSALVTPFDYPSCEQIGNSHLLLKNLYSDRLLGLPEIHAKLNLVLTGPRGCGKTTVFRALSLDYLTSVEDDDPSNIKYVGIYYRCDDLYFNFPRYEQPERLEALDVPMHFLIATLLAKALEQLETWAKRHFRKEFERNEGSLVAGLRSLLELQQPGVPGGDRLATLIGRLRDKERRRAAKKQRFVRVAQEPIENYFGPGRMIEACCFIREHLSFLRDRPFYFFIDDYSDPKITGALQANLNRLLMHRSSDVFFKLSTESPVSLAREDVDGKKFVESREFNLLNLGLRYITGDSNQRRVFLEDLFSRRFREVREYPVSTLEELLGSAPRNENAAARALREAAREKEQRYYYGCDTVAAMCSGDIHYMIRLVSKMVEDYGGRDKLATSDTTPRIPPRSQNKAVRAAAGEFMESIRTLPGNGSRLADIVSAFGNVARSYLLHETSGNGPEKPPHQASRIEPYEALQLSDDAQEVLKELLRYSVFIKDPRGKSRRGQLVPRFYLRRYLIPHFSLTFSRRDSLQLENDDLNHFLLDPRKFENMMRLKSKEDAERRREQRRKRAAKEEQAGLF